MQIKLKLNIYDTHKRAYAYIVVWRICHDFVLFKMYLLNVLFS